jgi:4-amino-4-deoxy-L-arabinose transferase-like glycosyltransferase
MSPWRRWHFLLVIVALWAPTYLLGLGASEIKSEEAKRIMPAQTMLASHDWRAWVLPSVGGEAYYKKPPGINWLIAGSFRLCGSQEEWAARLPSALLVGLLAGLMAGLPCPFLNPRAQFLAALIFLGSVGILENGRLIEIDGPYTAFAGLALVWWLYRYAARPRGWDTWIVPALFLAAGALLKGPFLAAAVYPVILLTLLSRRRLWDLLCPAHLAGIALILVLCLGWVLLARHQTNVDAMTGTWSDQIGSRVLPWHIQWGSWVLQIGRALVLMLPFVLLAPLLWVDFFVRRLPAAQMPYFRALRWGSAAGFVLLGMMPGAMARYALPVLPGVALALAAVLEMHRQPIASDRWWRLAVQVGFSAGAVVAVFSLIVLECVNPAGVFVAILALAAVALVAAWPSMLTGGQALTVATGVLMAVLAMELTIYSRPFRARGETRRPAGAAITRRVGADQVLDVYHPGYAPFLYYVRCPMRIIAPGGTIDLQVRSILLAGRDRDQPAMLERLKAQDFHVTYKISLQEGTWQLLQRQPESLDMIHPSLPNQE